MSLDVLKSAVRQYLAANYMFVDKEWLSGCVEFLSEEHSDVEEIKNLAKEQWLLNDLKDICPGCLPANITNEYKTELNGTYVLQINAAIDIGTPAYQQYLKLQKVDMTNEETTKNTEEKIPSRRMIKLFLTDGVQEISGIEYKPMRNLNCDITPGSKVLIKGPVTCRRGILFLTESSVQLLGGEVQEYAVSNSLAGLLSTKLELPIIQGPDSNPTVSQPRNTVIPAVDEAMPPPVPEPAARPVARVTSLQLAEFNDDEIDVDQLTAIEATIDNPSKRSLSDPTTSQEKKFKIDPINTNNVNSKDDYPTDDDLLIEDEDYLREIEAEIEAKERLKVQSQVRNVQIPTEPFVYIKQIVNMSESDRAGRVFKVKGQIMKLLSKLSVGKDGWSLKCSIVDGSASIDVEFTSNVLSKLVGYTPQEMNQLKKQMATKPELKEKAVTALQKAKDSLQVLYCIIELTMLEVPKITNLIPFSSDHLNLLNKRIEMAGATK